MLRFRGSAKKAVLWIVLLLLLYTTFFAGPPPAVSQDTSTKKCTGQDCSTSSSSWLGKQSAKLRTAAQTQENAVVVAACKDRGRLIKRALKSWTSVNPGPRRIIIVDWSSETPVSKTLEDAGGDFYDSRVRIVRVENEVHWILSWAFNIGAKVALMDPSLDKDTWMLKLDCDTFLYDNFFSSHPQLENTIYSGDYQLARNENEMHLNGVLYARLSHFLAVNGYDERIQTYGWDDDNLYQRLNQRGHVHLPIDTDELFHMAHSNFRRTAAQAIEHGEAVEIQINRMISEQVEPWNKTQSGLDFSPQDMDGQGGIVIQHRPPSLRALISGDEYQKVERNAMIFVLRKLGMPVHLQSFPAAYMDRLLVTLTKANHRPMLTLHAQYDLGSRLRSLLSAIIIAQKTKRYLRVIWIPDEYCRAKFTDLYDTNDQIDVWEAFDHRELQLPNVERYIYTGPESERAIPHTQIVLDTLNHLYIRTAGPLQSSLVKSRRETGRVIREQLQRSQKIQMMIQSFRASNTGKYIGVYIQNNPRGLDIYEDGVLSGHERDLALDAILRAETSKFINEMQRIIDQESKDTVFFICADSAETVRQVRDHFNPPPALNGDAAGQSSGKKTVIYLETRGDCYTTAKECVEYAFVEMMLLGNAKRILTSGNFNAFADVAAMKSGSRPSVVDIAFPLQGRPVAAEEIKERVLAIDL